MMNFYNVTIFVFARWFLGEISISMHSKDNAKQYGTVQYGTVQYSTVQYSTGTVQYSTGMKKYSTVPH